MKTQHTQEWNGKPWPHDPDNYWMDDKTGDIVSAENGKRIPARLIIAALDMLVTLKTMRNTLGFIANGMPRKLSGIARGLSAAANEMNDAIIKAEGEG